MEPFPENTKSIMFGMGHFWIGEQNFWDLEGVYCTHVGYAGGKKVNPNFGHVSTNIPDQHALVTRVVYYPNCINVSQPGLLSKITI